MKKILTLVFLAVSVASSFAQSNALKFDGSTVTTSADMVLTQYPGMADSSARTIEMWIKRGSFSTAQGIFCEMGQGSGPGGRFTVKVQNNHFRIESGGATNFLEGTTSLLSGQWYHVAVTLDPNMTGSDRLKMYVNGNLETQGNFYCNTDLSNSVMMSIGCRSNGVGAFNGAIDEFRVWNTALTQAQIQANMNAELCTLPVGLTSYFKFNEGVAGGTNTGITTTLDEVNTTNTNTLVNMSLTGTLSNFVTGTINSNTDLTVVNVTSCSAYTWTENSQTYATSGQYDVVLTNMAGCDSTIRLNLTIPVIDNTVTDNMNGTLTANMVGASYQWLDCNNGNAQIAGANGQTFLAPSTGNYSVELTNAGCKDTSLCINVNIVPTYVNPGMDFDGVDDYIQTQHVGITGNGARTVEAWIKIPVSNTTAQHTVIDWGSTTNGMRFTTNILANKLRLEVAGNGVTGSTLLNDDTWHFVAVTYNPSDNDTVRLYVDGVQEIAARLTVGVNTGTTTKVRIGSRIDMANFFYGSIDEVRIWNVARSAAEIGSMMNTSICTANPNLVLYYSFNEGTPFADNTSITNLKDYAALTNNAVPMTVAMNGSTSNFVVGPILPDGMDLTFTMAEACNSYTWALNSQTYMTSGRYSHTLTNGNMCDSVVVLDLTINTPTTGVHVQSACNSYTWIDNVTYTSSNNTATYTYVGGAANGCDSIVTLNLTINTPSSGIDVQNACGPFVWIDNNTYTTSNFTATHTIVGGSVYGCDSVVTLNLTIGSSTTGTDVQTACGSFTWIDNNTYYSSTNTPVYTIVGGNAAGCDSIVSLDLTIIPTATGTDVQSACVSYTWIDNNTYTSSNNTAIYTIVNGASNGCDSIVTLNLTIIPAATGTDVQSACVSYTWIDNNTYTSSNNTAVYTIANGAANGCDSIVTLNLTILNPSYGTDVQTACGSFTWIDNNTYTASNNTAMHTITNGAVNGCDSIVTLNLTILSPAVGTDVQTACDTYTWIDNNTYTSSNNTATYTIVGGAQNGCDSTVTLNLTINSSPVVQIVDNGDGSLTADVAGLNYQWYDCTNSQEINGENNMIFIPSTNGEYALIANDGTCADTSDCIIIDDLGIEMNSFGLIEVYPNPFNESIIVFIPELIEGTITITDLRGMIILKSTIDSNNMKLDLNSQPEGVYLVSVHSDKQTKVFRIVKGS